MEEIEDCLNCEGKGCDICNYEGEILTDTMSPSILTFRSKRGTK